MPDFFTVENDKVKRKATYIRWFITERCNYNCYYCGQNHSGKSVYFPFLQVRNYSDLKKWLSVRNRNSRDMFKNFSPDRWLQALDVFKEPLSLTFSGGEPFLDFRNFAPFLKGLSNMSNVRCIRIDTNGTWNPKNYPGVNWDKIYLNFSYHPSMISFDGFLKLLKLKTEQDINIGMVNYVMEPNQISGFEEVYETLKEKGIYVNANVYFGTSKQSEEGLKLYRKYIPELDIDIKTGRKPTKGLPCYYPTIAYEINTTGYINTGCYLNRVKDFMKGELPERFDEAVPCPYSECGCLDKYAFLADNNRGQKFNLMEEFVDECKRCYEYNDVK